MKYLSVCIPTYEMRGLGEAFLKQSFDVLTRQTFKDFEVVVSDHSKDDVIKDLCEAYGDKLDIAYHRNTEQLSSSSANINNTIRKAHGKLIKFLMQDDFLYKDDALEEIVKNFDLEKDRWLITACEHTTNGIHFFRPFYPKYHDNIHLGRNTISSPSVLTIKNDDPLFFDENLLQRTDGDYYKRCHDHFGDPKILNSINVVNRAGPHQVSNTMITEPLKDTEYRYVLEKYHAPFPRIHILLREIKKRINYTKRMIRKVKVTDTVLFYLKKLKKIARYYRNGDARGRIPKNEIDLFNAIKDDVHTVFDVGSRDDIDYYLLKPEAHYHLFEPHKPFVRSLKKKLGNGTRTVTINAYGLSDTRADDCTYYVDTQSFTEHYRIGSINLGHTYSLRTLSEYLGSHPGISHIDFLKIDTEGHDIKVLQGAAHELSSGFISYLQFEFWDSIRKHLPLLTHYDLYLMIEPGIQKGLENICGISCDKPLLPLNNELIDAVDHTLIPLGYCGNIFGISKSKDKMGIRHLI